MSKIGERIFAVVIGVNKYKFWGELFGAIADADDINDLLVQTFGADPNDIINLRDRAEETPNRGPATRDNIINKIRSLKDNPKIQKGDAIVIYFAGHGGRSTYEDWSAPNPSPFIESICPVDIGFPMGDRNEKIPGIPDFTIRALLNELSREKGNNITLILDSCHSGGANRDGKLSSLDSESTIRQYLNPPLIPQDCDSDILGSQPRGPDQAFGFQGQDLDSHVSLAACSSEQSAKEDRGPVPPRGFFTRALTAVLREKNISEITYNALISHIQDKIDAQTAHKPLNERTSQTPQLSGTNVQRLLFRDQVDGGDPSFISGYKTVERGFVLRAGAMLGVEEGSELQVYDNNLSDKSNLPMGTLVVTKVNTFDSILAFPPNAPDFEFGMVFFAKISLLPLKIYTEPSFREGVEQILSNLIPLKRSTFRWSDNPKTADIQLEISGDQLVFHRCSDLDQEIIGIIGSRIPYTLSTKDYDGIFKAIQGIAHFNRHFRTKGTNDAASSSLEFYEVKVDSGGFDHVLKWKGDNLVPAGRDTVEFVADRAKQYAATINNPSHSKDLYAYLFHFDTGSFKIEPWFTPNIAGTAKHAEAPLKMGSKLNIGHGVEGGPPWVFTLEPDVEKALGFLKLYLSNSPTELDAIKQTSPFTSIQAGNRGVERSTLVVDVWATKVIKLIPIRGPNSNKAPGL